MKRLRDCILALLLGCCTPLLIWVGAGVALYQRRKEVNLLKQALPNLVCSIDAECPSGYVCLHGRCVPEKDYGFMYIAGTGPVPQGKVPNHHRATNETTQ